MIHHSLELKKLKPKSFDKLLSLGYRHFGDNFFCYSHVLHNGVRATVLPLRIDLSKFTFSKSQKKIIKKNSPSRVELTPITLSDEVLSLFEEHKYKFSSNIPPDIHAFLGEDLKMYPCELLQMNVYWESTLYSVSFLDIGKESTSSVYGMFAFEYSFLSPGIYTMLLEIEYSIKENKKYYYPGYCYDISSYYDYKKKFSGLEYYDWEGNWYPYNGSD
jgi:arginine-tRNA-protein transferase